MNSFHQALNSFFSFDELAILTNAHIGIAGLGGLGSNVAMLLVRCGIEHFTLVDFDIVEASNLNRQFYFPEDLGLPKVEALSRQMMRLNPSIHIDKKQLRLSKHNVDSILAACRIWVEALDEAESKALFVQQALLNHHAVAAASGICGYGGELLGSRTLGNLTVVGDFKTDMETAPPLAPRTNWAASMLADVVLSLLLGPKKGNF
ncbi:MAG: sulfur carrier protein ThiS adenylyltransferase ThiF [Desulfovibrio sp.]|nr:sulfur carrier protein ThiS adenylyltransferase ThiF [Desulfovibrio sp.]